MLITCCLLSVSSRRIQGNKLYTCSTLLGDPRVCALTPNFGSCLSYKRCLLWNACVKFGVAASKVMDLLVGAAVSEIALEGEEGKLETANLTLLLNTL